MSESKVSMTEIEINLQQALAAAVEAARSAGRIIWEASQYLRTSSAASAAATSLPAKVEPSAGDAPQKPEEDTMEKGPKKTASAVEYQQDGKVNPKESHRLPFKTKAARDDLITEYDRRCDAAVIEVLQQYNRSAQAEHPHLRFHFITEELNPAVPLTDDLTWIVDPIDGTMSFVHGLPDCCVSIGLVWRKVPVLAVVFSPFLVTGHVGIEQAAELRRHFEDATQSRAPHDGGEKDGTVLRPKKSSTPCPAPLSSQGGTSNAMQRGGMPECVGELFTAIKGQGCFLNGVRVNVNAQATLKTAMMVLNFPCTVRLSPEEEKEPESVRTEIYAAKRAKAIDAVLEIRKRASLDHVPGIRAYCSTVVILSQIAAGRVDVYMEPGSKAWDVCAGALLVTEAGGVVTNLYGEPFDMIRDTSIAAGANEAMVNYITQLSREHSLGQYWLIQ